MKLEIELDVGNETVDKKRLEEQILKLTREGEELREMFALIDSAKTTADEIAAEVIKGVEKGRHIILTDRDGKIAYAAKRFVRPLYNRMMAKASVQMSKKD